MKLKLFILPILLLIAFSCSTTRNNKKDAEIAQHPSVKCMENSPERRGEEGCSILTDRHLVGPLTNAIYWHIDQFASLEAAMKAAGPNSVATEAHGSFWLVTVEMKAEEHLAGQHIARIGPLELPAADQYTMRVLSSLLKPGSTTPIHKHSGPEAFYIIDGEQCIERSETSQHLNAGQSYIVPANSVHRGRVIGSKARRALALVLYNAAYPATQDFDNTTPMVSCK